MDIQGAKCHVARGGYTGEDGFEISLPPDAAVDITEKIANSSGVQLTGLGARDSLRLEAGMCLYGNDLDESVSPIEAGLAWVVGRLPSFPSSQCIGLRYLHWWYLGKDRRVTGDFIGAERVLKELKEGPTRRRVGLEILGAPARQGAEIFSDDEQAQIGKSSRINQRQKAEDRYLLLDSRHNHVRYSISNIGYQHRHGIRQERLPQERYSA